MQRFSTLDGMRGAAAIAVMIHHITQHSGFRIFPGSGLGVDLFFCLSGFVIAHSYFNKLANGMNWLDFAKRRIIRLYPMYLIGVTFGAINLLMKVNYHQTSLTTIQAFTSIILNILYLPYISEFTVNIYADKVPSVIFPSNDPAWSLFFEAIVSILFCLVAIRIRKIYSIVATAIIGAIWLIVWSKLHWEITPGWGAENFYGGFPRSISGFFSGCVVYFVYQKYHKTIPNVPYYILIITSLALFSTEPTRKVWILGSLIAIPALVALSAKSVSTSTKANILLDYSGWLSYPIYCLHLPIYTAILFISPKIEYSFATSIATACITAIFAHNVTRFFEEPVRAYLTQRFSRSPAA
jgi:peptidoglycan/LPS O-acetylase OafA/YrhL